MHSLTNIKQLFASLGLILLLAGPFVPLSVHAQTNYSCPAGQTWSSTGGSGSGGCVPLPSGQPQNTVSAGDVGCSLTSWSTWDLCISNIVYYISVGLGSALAYLGAYVFDIAVQFSLNSLAYSIDFIASSWTVVRDIANMAFLFLLIYIAIIIMLKAETSGTMSMLAGVIVVALLVNFSFFFTRIVIDAGNILAVQFYNAIQAPTIAESMAGQTTAVSYTSTVAGQLGGTKDLTHGIMNAIGIQTLLNSTSFQQYAGPSNGGSQWFTRLISLSFLYLSIGAIFWILFAMFLTAGIKFMVRMVVLWLVIIASPLALVAATLTQTRSYYTMWQKTLISHAFYPTVFLFIYYIINQLVYAMSCGVTAATSTAGCQNLIAGALTNLQGTTTANQGFITSVAMAIGNIGIRLGLVIIMLYLGMRIANSVTVMGAKMAENVTSRMGGALLGGAVGWAGRNSLGWAGNRLSKNPTLNAGANQRGIMKAMPQMALNLSKRLSSATYDVRNAPKVKSVLEKAAGTTLGGTATTKGFTEQAKEASEKAEKERKERAAIVREAANKDALKRMEEDVRLGRAHNPADVSRVRNMSKNELGALTATQIQKIAHVLNEDKLKTVQDNDKYTDEEKERIRVLGEPIAKAHKILSDELRKLNDNLTNPAMHSAVVTANTARGATVNAASIGAMRVDLNAKLATLRGNLAGAPPGTAEDIKHDMTQIRNGVRNLRELERHTSRITAHNGVGAGEFVAY